MVKLDTRFIKQVIFNSVNDITKMEKIVNEEILKLSKAGGKIISIIPHDYGVSPICKIYTIVYQAEEPIQTS